MSNEKHPRLLPVPEEARVTPIELFFDLVFVFSLTQVTELMADDPFARGIVRGLLVLALLWWSWVGYAWLANAVQAEEGLGRVAMFGAMAAMFVMAVTVPEAFNDLPGGLDGPVVVAFAYLAVRVLHLVMFFLLSSADPGLRRQVWRFTPSVVGSTVVLLIASQLEGTAQTLTWVAALIVDYFGTILGGASGWRLRSASHFAERHGLIIIVALGESIVAIGVGVADVPISWPIIVASVLGLSVAACLWWAYFDVVSIVAERQLRRAEGEERARLARDAYSYLHMPMVAGIVLVALGMKKVMEYVGAHGGARAFGPAPAAAARRALRGRFALPARALGVQVPDLAQGDRPAAGGRGGARGAGAARRRDPGPGGTGAARRGHVRDDRDRVDAVLGGPRTDPPRGRSAEGRPDGDRRGTHRLRARPPGL